MADTSRWREGHDPVQRWLRVLTALVCLGVFVFLGVNPDRGVDDLPVLALALGAVLLLLGYEGLIKLPIIGTGDVPDRDSFCAHCRHPYHRGVCDEPIKGEPCDCDNRPVRTR